MKPPIHYVAATLASLFLLGLVQSSRAQFIWPSADQHNTDPSVYKEDPFVVKYRKEFFAVFRGDITTFHKAYKEIQAMVKKNPKDARALVWEGNGDTIEAKIQMLKLNQKEAERLLGHSREVMTRAVGLKPNDPQIYMMQAATLYIQGQYFSDSMVPQEVWSELARDCQHLLDQMGPQKMMKLSVHVRGETYGEMGVALYKLGKIKEAKSAFQKIIEVDPGTDYAQKAQKELDAIAKGKPLLMQNHA